ncbi:hydantoinase/oxoprolinase family protein [Hutsoniella sourekii]
MKVATDIGGTFTDLVFINDEGDISFDKASTTPSAYEQGVLEVLNQNNMTSESIESFIHGTTVIINALTERKGAKVGLITTKGFRDVLEIARGNRPDLFNVKYQKPEPFVERYLRREVTQRMDFQGKILTELDVEEVKLIIDDFKNQGVEAIAVALLHSYVNDEHEQKIGSIINEVWPEIPVSLSSQIISEWREYERTNTTVLNSYVQPIAESYINQLNLELDKHYQIDKKYIMQSNGGTTTFPQAKKYPIQLVESGPVAGIYGTAVLGKLIGEENLIAFDIGGTTAKCSLIENGEVKVSTDYYIEKTHRHAGYPIKVPVVDIVEIGNGGGSIAWLDPAGSLKVGPQSAGAYPGPVAYNLGGQKVTTTDANLYTGRLTKDNFDFEVNMDSVEECINNQLAKPLKVTTEEAALGVIRIANSNMLNALKLISTRKGYDPKDFSLVAFGGGGPMHAALLGAELGVKKVIIPLASSVFAAWGMLMTDLRQDYIRTSIQDFTEDTIDGWDHYWELLKNQAYQEMKDKGLANGEVELQYQLDMRYQGQEHTVKVSMDAKDSYQTLCQKFHQEHKKSYTFDLVGTPIQIVNYHLTAIGHTDKPTIQPLNQSERSLERASLGQRRVFFEDRGWLETSIYNRNYFPADHAVNGPAIIEEKTTSTIVYPGQLVYSDKYGNLIIEMEG